MRERLQPVSHGEEQSLNLLSFPKAAGITVLSMLLASGCSNSQSLNSDSSPDSAPVSVESKSRFKIGSTVSIEGTPILVSVGTYPRFPSAPILPLERQEFEYLFRDPSDGETVRIRSNSRLPEGRVKVEGTVTAEAGKPVLLVSNARSVRVASAVANR